MASLTAHLRRPSDHGRLPFHPECPLCRSERLSGPLPADAVVGRRTQALLAAGVLALSTATPTAVLAAEPDQEQEGAAAPDQAATQVAPSAPVYDPGGDSTDVPFDAAAAPDSAEQDPAADALEQDEAASEGTAVADSGDDSGSPASDEQPASTAQDPPSAPPAAEPIQQASEPAPEAPTADRQATTPPVVTQDWRQRDDEARTAKPRRNDCPGRIRRPRARRLGAATRRRSRPERTLHRARRACRELVRRGQSRSPRRRGSRGRSGRVAVVDRGDCSATTHPPRAIAREVNRLWELNSSRIGTGDPDLLMAGTQARAAMNGAPATSSGAAMFIPAPLVDGRPASSGAAGRLRRRMQRLLVSTAEREEADLERRIRAQPGVTRPNTIALISPKGGVGKTTSTFVVGQPARHPPEAAGDRGRRQPGLRDARAARARRSPLGAFARRSARATPTGSAPPRSSPRTCRGLPTGLHMLGAPRDAALTASLGPERYGELVAFLSTFYEVVLLDLGTGVAGPLARFAIERADQVVLVTTPEWVTSSVVLEALSHVQHDHTTVAINKSQLGSAASTRSRIASAPSTCTAR